jgi:putative ABC transport system permease protein
VQQSNISRPESSTVAGNRTHSAWLFTLLAFQNLLRRPTRTLMLVFAVALATGAVFASFTVMRGIEASMQQSFARMGADLIVVPQEAMVNITSSLLTVQPTDATLDNNQFNAIKNLDGVARVAPQTIYHVPFMAGMPEHKINLIAFDPVADFTITPWVVQHLPRTMQSGDLLSGGRRAESIADEVSPCGVPSVVYAKLGRSGVGPLDDSLFATYDTVENIISKQDDKGASALHFDRTKISAALVQLKSGTTPEQVRFAISQIPGLKVITGARIVTATRQTTTALLGGMVGFAILMLIGLYILITLLFGAIISERRREIGLLRAIGSRKTQVMGMLIAEAVFATSAGGLIGILFGSAFLLVFERSLVYHLETLHVEFAWPLLSETISTALICAAMASIGGLIGAIVPAWKASNQEPHLLIQSEGG